MTLEAIGRVRLQTEYDVFADGERYVLEGHVRADPRRTHAQDVTRVAVEAVAGLLDEGFETAKAIAEAVEEMGRAEHGFRYRYGSQLYYEVQRALLVLVALGEASVQRVGRRFLYEVAE